MGKKLEQQHANNRERTGRSHPTFSTLLQMIFAPLFSLPPTDHRTQETLFFVADRKKVVAKYGAHETYFAR